MSMRQNDLEQARLVMSMICTGMAVYDASGDRLGRSKTCISVR